MESSLSLPCPHGHRENRPNLLRCNRFGRFVSLIHPSRIPTVVVPISTIMYYSHPFRLAKSSIAKQNVSHGVNDVCNGSPSRIRRVLLISFGMTILPRSSTRRTMPVAFIILFSFEARNARFAPVAVFAGKGELCNASRKIKMTNALALSSPRLRTIIRIASDSP